MWIKSSYNDQGNRNSIQIEDTVVLDASGETDFEQVVKLTKVKL